MRYPEFRYVDVAIGGVTKRNCVHTIDDLPSMVDQVDCYTTMFLFKEEYQKHVKSTGSVRGADQFKVWSPYLWFDIDAPDLQDATIDMQALLRGVRSMGVLDHVVVFFSGSKGYHIGIDAGVFGFEPSQTLPDQMRRVATQIASLFNIDTLDTKVYNHNRLWRVPDTFHGKTKLRKTVLKPEKAIEMSVDEIKRVASSGKGRRGPRYVGCDNTEPVDSLVRLSREASAGAVEKSANWDAPPLSDRRAKIIMAGLDYLLEHGVTRGDRDNEALLRASECRKIGLTEDECLSKMLDWNRLNEPPLTAPDVERVVSSAYTGPGYDFGTNHDSLRIAREQGRKSIDEIDVEKLLNGNNTETDDDKFVRRPRSVSELLAGGAEPDAPETVGEYFSWRKRITLLVGREKYSGKSTLCTFEVMAALRKGYRCLWVSPDEPREDILYRLVKAGVREYADQCVIASDMDVPNSWPELGQFIVDAKPDIIILDSIHSLFPIINNGKVPDSSESAEWQKLVAKLRPLAIALDASVVWLHHANKATGLSAGSIGITAAVDAIVNLGTVRKPNRRTLQYLGRRVNSTFNCALDYLDEEKGYERVKDWNQSMQNEHDEKSKNEVVLEWLMEFVASHESDTFERAEAMEAYRSHFNEDPDKGRAFKIALAELRKQNIIGWDKTKHTVGQSFTYNIINRESCGGSTKPSDLTGDREGEA